MEIALKTGLLEMAETFKKLKPSVPTVKRLIILGKCFYLASTNAL